MFLFLLAWLNSHDTLIVVEIKGKVVVVLRRKVV